MEKDNKEIKNRKAMSFFAKYSSLAFQMGLTIVGITFAGYWADIALKNDFKIFTIICSILSVFIALYFAVKDLLKK